MPKSREELRRGLRALIERTSHEMEALGDPSSGETEPEGSANAATSRGAAPDAVASERSSASEGAGTGSSGSGSPASTSTPASGGGVPDPSNRPMLLLVRNTVRTLIGTRKATPEATAAEVPTASALTPAGAPPAVAPAAAPAAAPAPHREAVDPAGGDVDVHFVHPRRGVCESYYVNHACWEVPDAFCNHALHTCMLRDCPVYNLHREELEKRFASRYSHLW